ncbi:Asx homology domain-containing protein [Diplogelasinospora grovesii]|uniref:Asx homology domain-containing protein n=1 Tax=Diplogelasinospora grovesii TaxID=303347 RepID=A0AAN6NGD9_9PEZI|nr:Asx homology domain-containing protein [Diplogelasinospora grovesii]
MVEADTNMSDDSSPLSSPPESVLDESNNRSEGDQPSTAQTSAEKPPTVKGEDAALPEIHVSEPSASESKLSEAITMDSAKLESDNKIDDDYNMDSDEAMEDEEDEDKNDSQPTTSTARKRPRSSDTRSSSIPLRKARRTARAAAARRNKKWAPPSVYTNEKSPLTRVDLRAMLLLPRAWDILPPLDQINIIEKFPDETHIINPGTDFSRPNLESLRNDDNFRHDCTRYIENLKEGRHDEDWLQQAWIAHEKHKRGDFDAHLVAKFEADWDIELPEEHCPQHLREREELFDSDDEDDVSVDDNHDAAVSSLSTGVSQVTVQPATTNFRAAKAPLGKERTAATPQPEGLGHRLGPPSSIFAAANYAEASGHSSPNELGWREADEKVIK